MALALAVVRHRRRLPRRAHELRSADRPGAAALRVRGGDHRRARAPSGARSPAAWSSASRRRSAPRSTRAGRSWPATSSSSPCSRPAAGPVPEGRVRMATSCPVARASASSAARTASRVGTARRRWCCSPCSCPALLGRPGRRCASVIEILLPIWRSRRCGTCSPATPGWSRSASRPSSASAATRCSCSAIFLGLNPFLAVPLAGLLGRRCSRCPTAFVVFRLRGAYFAIGTWVVAEVFRLGFAQITALGGGSGMSLPADIVQGIAGQRSRCARASIYLAGAGSSVVLAIAARLPPAALALRAWR